MILCFYFVDFSYCFDYFLFNFLFNLFCKWISFNFDQVDLIIVCTFYILLFKKLFWYFCTVWNLKSWIMSLFLSIIFILNYHWIVFVELILLLFCSFIFSVQIINLLFILDSQIQSECLTIQLTIIWIQIMYNFIIMIQLYYSLFIHQLMLCWNNIIYWYLILLRNFNVQEWINTTNYKKIYYSITIEL